MIRDYLIYYFLMFAFIFIVGFLIGRSWERLDQEEQKSRDTITYMPVKKNKW